ncbi:MAG: right-handed parallel beta-helix repeat-containing protein [Fimbriimonadaceae bacterium]|nr:right-handed parallel beta-helix repeat-containing protein [Fimbriimonadaceae bacterium]
MGRLSLAVCLVAPLGVAAAEVAPPARILVVGTNTPADAATINAAIAASPEGSEVVFRGRFLINQTIRLRSGRSYAGESRAGTVLRQADGANLPALLASEVWLDNTTWTGTPMAIRRLTLDGNRAANQQTAGLVLRSWLSVAEDLHITNMPSDGLRLTSLSADGTGLKTTQVNGRLADCFIERSGRHGIFVEDPGNAVTDWILRDNWIASSGADGIHLDNAAGWIIERNHIYGVPQHGIYAHRLFATSLSDNYIEGFGETAQPGTWCGILAIVQGDAASTITGNRIFGFGGEQHEGSTYRYLAVTPKYGAALVTVSGNAIRGAGTARSTGLHYEAAAGRTLTVVSTGNAVDRVGTPRLVGERVTLAPGL